MIFSQPDGEANYNKSLEANAGEPFGECILKYAKLWAEAMENKMAEGQTLEECAKSTSNAVDELPGMGITGYMYGAVVQTLAQCWEHGEVLRVWHNGEYNVDAKGVVNPAIITIGN